MKTTSLGIENLCVPCNSFCRYCLLSSSGKSTGVEYQRGKNFAKRIYLEAKQEYPELKVFHYIGYCMDHDCLVDYIKFSQEIQSPSASFLQLNGLRMRDKSELQSFIGLIAGAGISEIDLTFYGTREYHDRFAGRIGDFNYLLQIFDSAKEHGLNTRVSVPLHKENIKQADELLALFGGDQTMSIFLPHSKGRGKCLDSLRLTMDDCDQLSSELKTYLDGYLPECEWIKRIPDTKFESRVLTLSLAPENIDLLEAMSLKEIISDLEMLDDQYYNEIPPIEVLAAQYGDTGGRRLYRRFRDLYLEWQQKYITENRLNIWDINDETHHFSTRY